MGKIRMNGVDLYYEQEGRGEELLLISGYTTDISTWNTIRQHLAKNFHVIMFDNRGSGRSDSIDQPYTIEMLTEDARAIIKELKLEKPHLLGHSMGGAIAQTLAYKSPQLVNKLILSNTFTEISEISSFAFRYFYKMRAQGMTFIDMIEGIMPWLFSDSFLNDEKQVQIFLDFAKTYPFPQSLTGQKRQLEALLPFNSKAWIGQLSMPTLVIGGEKDIICSGESNKLQKFISGSQCVIFPDQRHLPHIEIPERFVEAVIQFLKQTS